MGIKYDTDNLKHFISNSCSDDPSKTISWEIVFNKSDLESTISIFISRKIVYECDVPLKKIVK